LMECKCYRRIDWRHFLIERRGDFHAFYARLVLDVTAGTLPLLIVKENQRPTLTVTSLLGTHLLFGDIPPLLSMADDAGFVYPLSTLLEQDYKTVVDRLVKWNKHDVVNHRSEERRVGKDDK